eukprot:1158903-Pelagomonas_calceolata.AAC.24
MKRKGKTMHAISLPQRGLQRHSLEKREKEERELAAVRERERIRAGKEMQLALRKEQEGQLKRNVEVS